LKLVLSDALHARPASLFVRLAQRFASSISLRRADRRADGKNILEVLALGAGRGETLDVEATGENAEAALAALAALVERNFDADLVPETGTSAAPGVALGRAVLLTAEPGTGEKPAATARGGPDAAERIENAFAQVIGELERMVQSLPGEEAVLFEPEIAIVRALEGPVLAKVAAGASPEQALRDETSAADARNSMLAAELVVDARNRLLDAYADEGSMRLARTLARAAGDGDIVLVVEALTPSVVAAAPEGVVGIVAAAGDDGQTSLGRGYTSHAAILARGRDIPLLFVPSHVALSIAEGELVVLDAMNAPPRLWVAPSEARIAEARAAKEELKRAANAAATRLLAPLAHLVTRDGTPFAVRVNVGSVHDAVPKGTEGIGLVRTELFFSGRGRAPSAEDQLAMLALVAGKAVGAPVVTRLFDAGGDKPIRWLAPPQDAPDARGFDLLRRYPDVLAAQIGAVARAAVRADVRLLIPLAHGAADVDRVRSMAPKTLPVGAMIESPAAVEAADEIARAADFVCIGTNDLAAFVRGEDRARAMAAPLDSRVLAMVSAVVEAAHRHERSVTVCGEVAGDPDAALVLVGLGVDAISVAPSRFAAVKTALLAADAGTCAELARRAIREGNRA
jgi:phosphotransferase system HPr (HPr) family protein